MEPEVRTRHFVCVSRPQKFTIEVETLARLTCGCQYLLDPDTQFIELYAPY